MEIKRHPDADERLKPVIAEMRRRAYGEFLRVKRERAEAERIMMLLRLVQPEPEEKP